MTEIWKDIKGFEGSYQASSNGRIRNKKGRTIKPTLRGDYLKVSLYKNGRAKQLSVHRIIAETFLNNPDNLPVVNHKDEDKFNNLVENLEWCSVGYNTKYNGAAKRAAKAKRRPVIGTNIDTGVQVYFHSIAEAEELGYASHSHIVGCLKGYDRRKSAGGYSWKYA